jgi:nucleotide-binding universal stress UspA family protein
MNWLPRGKVVVPVDFSDDSFDAIDVALEIAGDASRVHVFHVMPEPHIMEPEVQWQMIDSENRSRRAEEALRSRLSDEKYRSLHIEIDFGNPGYRIAEYAEKTGADLIVMPSHGRSGVQRIMLGSVAERVTRLSHCPILVLRKPP